MRKWKNIIAIFLLVLNINAKAQKCHYDIDKYDKFLKIRKQEKEIKLNAADFGGDGYLKLTFCKYDTLTFFRITYITRHATVVSTYDDLNFLLENDSIVKAFPNQIYSGDLRINTVSTQSVLNATYFFESSNDVNKLKSNKVKSIRIHYNSVYADYDIKGKHANDLHDIVQCF